MPLIVCDEDAGAEGFFREAEDAEDGEVDFALAGGKFPGDGDGAGHVSVPPGVFCGDVEEEEVAFFQEGVVGDVVEDAGVLAAGDDGCVGEAAGAGAGELVDELGLYFPFSDAGLYEPEDAVEAFSGDAAGDLGEADFLWGLDGAELVEEWGEAGVAVEGEAGFAVFDEAVVVGLDGGGGAGVLVGGEVEGF